MKFALLVFVFFCGSTKAAFEPVLTMADVPKWDSRKYKVDHFIEAAAKFQALGKEKACALLLDLSSWTKAYDRHEAQFLAVGFKGIALEHATYISLVHNEPHYQGIIILCRMLFMAKPNNEFRRARVGYSIHPTTGDWPLDPIEMVEGVPFLIETGRLLAGLPEPPGKYVDYCIKNCDWNTYQFKPKSEEEKQKALEKLLAMPKLQMIHAADREFLAAQIDRPDILLADFEGDAYPDGWKTTGTAFGKGPAKGTLPGQMAVSGFLGKGLVNSFAGGDTVNGHAHVARVQDRAEVSELPRRRREARRRPA